MNTSAAANSSLPHVTGFGDFKAGPLATSMVVGNLLNWGLFGVIGVQASTYYLAFPADPLYVKCMIYFILVNQFAQTILCSRDAFICLVQSLENPVNAINTLDQVNALWLSYPIMGGLVGIIYQCFTAHRVYKSFKNKISAISIILLSAGGFGGALSYAIQLKNAGSLKSTVIVGGIFKEYGIWNASSAACDIIITSIAVYKLLRHSENTEPLLLINKIIRLTVETGMITAVAEIASVIVYIGFRRTPVIVAYFLVPGLIVGKLHGITLLAALNSRLEIVGGRHNTDTHKQSTEHFVTIEAGEDYFSPPVGRTTSIRSMGWGVPGMRSMQNETTRFEIQNQILVETRQEVRSDKPRTKSRREEEERTVRFVEENHLGSEEYEVS